MADGTTPRHRFGAIVFGLAAVAALLAVFPATAPAGMILCFLLVVPAIVAVWRARRAPVGARRRSWVALAVAPVFFVVAAGVMPHPPVTATAVEAAPAGVSAAAPTSDPVAPATVAPTTVAAPVTTQVVPVPAPVEVAAAVAPAPAVAAQVVAPQAVAPQAAAPKAAAAPQPAAPKPVAGASCGANSYINSSGNCVPRPVAAATAPAGATAQCKDGDYSFSQHRSGTCSGHGGVSRWL